MRGQRVSYELDLGVVREELCKLVRHLQGQADFFQQSLRVEVFRDRQQSVFVAVEGDRTALNAFDGFHARVTFPEE